MIAEDLQALMALPGLSGHEAPVARAIAARLEAMGLAPERDRLGNLWCTVPGEAAAPTVMVFAHMDQLGFVVRRVDAAGFLWLERLGGVPERALPAQAVVISTRGGDVPGVIGHKSHHATAPEEKLTVLRVPQLYVDCGFESAAEAAAAGVRIGDPVVYAPGAVRLGAHRLTGPAIDDRAGCAVLLALAEALAGREGRGGPTVHLAFTVQEEFNLRGAQPLAQRLAPDIAIQLDLALACDTPDMEGRGEMVLGGGPAVSLYSFHGRGTLNGVIPHPALVQLVEQAAEAEGLTLQRQAASGVLTDNSYVQFVGEGVAAIDLGFPLRYTHAAREVVDMRDLGALARLLEAMLARIGPDLELERR